MANPRENLIPEMSETALLNGDDHNRNVAAEEDYAETAVFCGCGCLPNFGAIRWRRDSDGSNGRNGNIQDERRESWMKKKLKELKEISEKIAGPKWKNFIRRFSNSINNKKTKIRKNLDFRYDARSYGLNFDDGERCPNDFPAPVIKNSTELSADSSLL